MLLPKNITKPVNSSATFLPMNCLFPVLMLVIFDKHNRVGRCGRSSPYYFEDPCYDFDSAGRMSPEWDDIQPAPGTYGVVIQLTSSHHI
jgi:hypothetical protein